MDSCSNTTESRTNSHAHPKLNAEIIAAAIEGFESQKRRIDTQIEQLRAICRWQHRGNRDTGSTHPEGAKSVPPPVAVWPKTEKKMGGNKGGISGQIGGRKTKRKISAAGKRAISEARSAGWAFKRAEAARPKQPAAKKATTQMTAQRGCEESYGESGEEDCGQRQPEQAAAVEAVAQ